MILESPKNPNELIINGKAIPARVPFRK